MNEAKITLCGSTWDHTRGYDPMAATARCYRQDHPNVEIVWERRTLEDFAELSVHALSERYDLVVIDHPWIGEAVLHQSLLALDEYLDAAFLIDQQVNSVGPSHRSYQEDGHQWALAIDAACHVSAWRPDLLEKWRLRVPMRWDEVLDLGSRLHLNGARIAIPLAVVDCNCVLLSLCANFGDAPMRGKNQFVSRATGRRALEMMLRLRDLSHPESFDGTPPQLLDRMAETDEIVYCPLLFGYSNYARKRFRRNIIRFGNIPLGSNGKPSGALLGGAGIAVSSFCRWPREACDYAAFVASPSAQCGIYMNSGGQPGHRSAWCDSRANEVCHNFFRDTIETLDHAYLRPTFDGFIDVQNNVARIVYGFLHDQATIEEALDSLDGVYSSHRGDRAAKL